VAACRFCVGDFDLAAACGKRRCRRGVNLGQAYRLGRGVPTDLALAQTWLEKAAGSGHLDA
jgi:TPR repeat protein